MRRTASVQIRAVSARAIALAVGASLACSSALAGPHVETINGHQVLVVDGAPFLNLAVQLQENTSQDPDGLEAADYLGTARDAGFRAVRVPVRWRTYTDRLTRPVFRAVDPTRADLNDIIAAARANGLKLNIAWEGSNLFGRANFAPEAIAGRSGTFHPQGDFAPPASFDFLNDPASYPNHVLVTNPDGSLAITDGTTNANEGVFCPDWPNTLAAERDALLELANRIALEHLRGDLVVTFQIENELALVDEPDIQAQPTQRCRCALSEFLFDNPDIRQPGFDPTYPTFGEYQRMRPDVVGRLGLDETYTQWSLQRYVGELGKAIRTRVPDLPIIVNVFGVDNGSTPEPDHPGSPFHDLEGWLEFAEVVSAGPDMFGFEREVYQPGFSTPNNFLYAPEFGAQYYPHFQVFGALGSNVSNGGPRFIGMGMSTFALYGDVVSLFTGLVSDGVTRGLIRNAPVGFWFENILFSTYHAAYYARASNTSIGSAMAPLARFQGTDNLLAFFDGNYLPGEDNFSGGVFEVGGTRVTLADLGNENTPARGAIVRNGVRDYTIVGVSYRATLDIDARDGRFVVERGEWRGQSWVALAEPLAGSVSVDSGSGALTVTMSADERTTQGAVAPGEPGPRDLQYVVRVYDPTDPGPDAEGDGVADDEDNCPGIENPGQIDSDDDGIGDLCDVDSADRDGDGVPDAADNCPDVPNSNQADADRDGVGDQCERDTPPTGGSGGSGGGCAVASSSSPGPTALLAPFALLWVARRRREV